MFKQVILFIIFIIITYLLAKKYFHKIYLASEIIKYKMTDKDKELLTKCSNIVKLNDISGRVLFYTNSKWTARNNSYVLVKDRYYIIEPGYYYYLEDNYTIHSIGIDIFSFDFEKWNNKIKI